MPVNNAGSAHVEMLSGIEEETDLYEGFSPHVDTNNVSVIADVPSPGKYHNVLKIYAFFK